MLASDAIHYDDELERERPFGIFSDLADMYRGYATLRATRPPAPRSSPGTTRP